MWKGIFPEAGEKVTELFKTALWTVLFWFAATLYCCPESLEALEGLGNLKKFF